jgi:hypothetical protein
MSPKHLQLLDWICQYFLASQIDCTLNNFAEYGDERLSHDDFNCHLGQEKHRPGEHLNQNIQTSKRHLIFSNTVAKTI